MMVGIYVEVAFALLIAGAIAAGLMRSWRSAGWMATVFVGAATAFAWMAALSVLASGKPAHAFIVALPGFGSELSVSLDLLGAGFLLIITAVSFLSTLYSVGYMGIYRHESPGRFYFLLQVFLAGMVGVVCVADWLFFIVLWELMTLASYFLVTFERDSPEAVRAGFKYFVMTHVATAGLLVTAVVLWRMTGSFSFEAHRAGMEMLGPVLRNLLLALYLIAFSTKAGIFPFGDWLPDAHPAAPSGVSAILSGVMIKLGAYGVLRVFWGMLPDAGTRAELMTWGVIIAALGTLSAFVGGVTAMRQNDSKRLLAFSSISQTGYIFLALGIGVAFTGHKGLENLALLGFLGAGFHILNDAVYKSLLFMSAGSVLFSTGTRDLNKIGGLSAVMPIAAGAGLIGVLSLAGLPPTNGFASKWVIYQASISGGLQFAPFIAAAVVAFFVSLSTLAYALKFYSTAFLGATDAPQPTVPLPGTMNLAQGVLALVCIAVGLSPFWAMGAVSRIFGAGLSQAFYVTRSGSFGTLPTGGAISAAWSPLLLFGGLLVCFLIAELIRSSGRAQVRAVPNWLCGEEHPSDELRFRAKGFYSPFNEAFAKVYPHVPIPRWPGLKRLRAALDLDTWLYNPLVRTGGNAVDKVSRSHVGIPQLYMIWQVAGMVLVIAVLIWVVK
ncbi:MAG: oxidoreductase [Armatimonadetes bacterium]|nr:oxidoreductase [Armatimonadota bacterium]